MVSLDGHALGPAQRDDATIEDPHIRPIEGPGSLVSPYPLVFMFTGLIQHIGAVQQSIPIPEGRRLVIDPAGWSHRPALGDSISISGCCLTVAQDPGDSKGDAHRLVFDVIHESLAKTTLGDLREGDQVNLEHALTPTTLLGGHFVQGHVDGVGHVINVEREDHDWRIRVEPPPAVSKYLVPKGSIAIDGVSLTIADLSDDWFEVALIPTTLEKTTLDALDPGDRVNLEADVLAKTIVQTMERMDRSRSAR